MGLSKGQSAQQDGFTLVELLVASAVLIVALGVATGAVAAAMRSSRHEYRERIQRMQIAINQIGEDLAYSRWAFDCSSGPCSTPAEFRSMCPSNAVPYFTLPVYQPIVDPITVPTGHGGPGYLLAVPLLKVRYTLAPTGANVPGTLTREVLDENTGASYVRQELVTNLIACNRLSPGHADDSYLEYNNGQGLFRAVLRTNFQEGGNGAGTTNRVEVRGTWYAP
jgi:type II secretory pathway pseudopilin PulG